MCDMYDDLHHTSMRSRMDSVSTQDGKPDPRETEIFDGPQPDITPCGNPTACFADMD